MKRMLLVLTLAGGMVGCDAGEKLRWSPPEPKVNPLTLLDLNLGIEAAVCKYGIDTEQLKSNEECGLFWKGRLRDVSREVGDNFYGGNHYPEINMNDVKYGTGRGGVSLMIYVGEDPIKGRKASAIVMIGEKLFSR